MDVGILTSKELDWSMPSTQALMRAVQPEEIQHASKDPRQLPGSLSSGLGLFLSLFSFLSSFSNTQGNDKTESCHIDAFTEQIRISEQQITIAVTHTRDVMVWLGCRPRVWVSGVQHY